MADDHERWRRTYEDEQERLWRSLLAYSCDPDVAADAVAEAFAQGIRRGVGVRDPAAWVWRSAFRIAAGMLAASIEEAKALRDSKFLELWPDAAAPDELIALLDALGRLTDDDRRVVVLALVAGMDSAAIGEVVGAGSGAVRVRLHRARGRLRVALGEEPDASASAHASARPDGPASGGDR